MFNYLKSIIPGLETQKPSGSLLFIRMVLYNMMMVALVCYYNYVFSVTLEAINFCHSKYIITKNALLGTSVKNDEAVQKYHYSREELKNMVASEAIAQGFSPPILAQAVVQHESQWVIDAVKHEVGHLNKPSCKQEKNPDRKRLCASSHGLFQIMMSLHKDTCGVQTFSELYDPKINIPCGIKILKGCAEEWKHAPKWQKASKILECYNGSSEYPPKVFAELGALIAERMESEGES